MKQINTVDAVGHILCQDITKIEKGKFKGPIFKKGHIVKEEDIEVLLNVGKKHLYVWDEDTDLIHENDAAIYIYDRCAGENLHKSEIKEGKIEALANVDGLIVVDTDKLFELNMQDEIMMATQKTNIRIEKGHKVFGTRIIPLAIEKEKLEKVDEITGGKPIVDLLPFKHKKVGIVVTGSEVYTGRIEDKFGPTILEKLKAYDVEILGVEKSDDDVNMIQEKMEKFLEKGANLILCSGGMSVDPDDVTPSAIKNIGANIVSYGSPVLPGAMFLVSYLGDIPILGLPGCVMFMSKTIFEVILPNVMADYKIDKKFIARLGHGGLNVKTIVE